MQFKESEKAIDQALDGLFQKAGMKPLDEDKRNLAKYFITNPGADYSDFARDNESYKHYSRDSLYNFFLKGVVIPLKRAIARVHQKNIPENCYTCLSSGQSKCQFDNCKQFKITIKNIGLYIKKFGVFPRHNWSGIGRDINRIKQNAESTANVYNDQELEIYISCLQEILDERSKN